MGTIIEIIDKLCEERGIKGSKLCDDIGISRSTLTELRKGRAKTLSVQKANLIATYFGVSVDYLSGTVDSSESSAQNSIKHKKTPTLTKKDERDIKKKMDEMLELFDSSDALMFDGEPLDEETRQLLRDSYENQLRMTKQLAKAKFTPKKYQD